jgi:ABC-type amino acid transport/signal transduction systems, periplasmic component/domain
MKKIIPTDLEIYPACRQALLFIGFLLLVGLNVFSQEAVTINKIKTGVYISPPFTMKDSAGYYYGMAIDLWELLEDEMNFVTDYIEYPSWHEMMEAVVTGEIDAAVSNISVTYERAKNIKFSFPWFDSGLRIMVLQTGKGSIWQELKRNGHLQAYLIIIIIILSLSITMTWIYRKREPKFPKTWADGLAESLYRLVLALKTGVVNNKNYSWVGKILAVIWMLSGVGLVAYVTSGITSSMTTIALTHDIHSLSDLPGKRVGVLSAGIAEEYMQNRGIPTIGYETIETATQALINNEIDAIVEDAPVLEYWAFTNPQQKVKVVGTIFHPDKYAFAANNKYSIQMDLLSVKLIKLLEQEKVNALKNNYFGNIH